MTTRTRKPQVTVTPKPLITIEPVYRTVDLTRNDGAYISIGCFDGRITSFYENYGFSMNGYRASYNGQDVNSVVTGLLACEWKVI